MPSDYQEKNSLIPLNTVTESTNTSEPKTSTKIVKEAREAFENMMDAKELSNQVDEVWD